MNFKPEDSRPPADTGAAPQARLSFLSLFPSIMLPMFLGVIDQTIVATALPAIAGSLGEVEHVAWVVVAYLVATTTVAPVYGRLGDHFGRRRLMFVALALFMAASVLCALAESIAMLVAARVLQGLGGGGLMTLSQALIGETVPPRERARYQGYLAAVAVASNTLGPVLGGFLTEHLGWQSIFLVNIPIGIVAIVLVLRIQPLPGVRTAFRFDVLGLILFSVFVASGLTAVQQVRSIGSGSPAEMLALTALSLAALILLIWRERRARDPLLPLALFRNPSIWRCDALAACHGGMLVSLITFLPIYLRVVHGASPAEIGLLLLPMTAGIGIGSMTTGRMMSRTGYTAIFPSVGLVVAVLTLGFLGYYADRLSSLQLSWLLGWLAVFMGTVMGVVQVTVQAAAGAGMLGSAAATVQFSRSLGAALGTAVVSVVLFAVVAAADPEAARLFGSLIQEGPAVLSTLSETRRLLVEAEIAGAFRVAFLTIAGFGTVAIALAWSIPIRRI